MAYPIAADGKVAYPEWQFTAAGSLLPHLATVLAAIPPGAALLTVRTFMTMPTTDLINSPELPAVPVSPAQWLATGRDPPGGHKPRPNPGRAAIATS